MTLPSLLRRSALTLAAALAVTLPAAAQSSRNPSAHNLGDGQLAIQGYDPVAYFEEFGGQPTKGSSRFTVTYDGVVYHFASEANMKAFENDPARFEPAHGGWCSYGMALDAQIEIDPKAFRIGEGRLLLFSDTDYLEFDGDWVPKERSLLGTADKNWKKRSGEDAREADRASFRRTGDYNLSDDSLAIQGYDPVAYFPEGGGKAKKGSAKHQTRHGGVTYRFASAANLETFRKDPAKYEPQHGGWCSYAMGVNGDKVEIDPEAFRLTDGQLHLFYTGWFADTREDWDADTKSLKKKADANWEKLLAKADRA